MFCILSLFSVLGGALYERRHELGLETWASPERTEELERGRDLERSEKEVWDAYGQMRAGTHTDAWQRLQAWLASRGNTPEDYRWLCARVADWSDPRYVTRLTEEYVERLLLLKRNGEALDVGRRPPRRRPLLSPQVRGRHPADRANRRRRRRHARRRTHPARGFSHALRRRPAASPPRMRSHANWNADAPKEHQSKAPPRLD